MGKLDRTKRKKKNESSILPGRGRNSGQQPTGTGIGRSSSSSPRPGDSVDPSSDCSSDCSSSSTSPRLSITTPPRAGLHRSMERPSCSDLYPKEEAGEGGSWRSGMRLLNLNQDLLFSECISFPIRKEGATVVGSGEAADIRLDGDDVLPHHATIVLRSDGTAVLSPTPGARVYINGILISADEEMALPDKGQEGEREIGTPGDRPGQCGGELRRDYRVVFGSRHYFRVDCPFQYPATVGNHEGVAETMPARIDWEFAQEEIRANNSSTFQRRRSSPVAASTVLDVARPANTTGTAAGVGVDVDEKPQPESKRVLPGGRHDSQLLGNGGVSLPGPVADTTEDSLVAMDKRSVSQALPNQETPPGDVREPSVDKVWVNEPSEIFAPGDIALSDGNCLPSPRTPPAALSPLERPDAGDTSREIHPTSEVPAAPTIPPSPSPAETDTAVFPDSARSRSAHTMPYFRAIYPELERALDCSVALRHSAVGIHFGLGTGMLEPEICSCWFFYCWCVLAICGERNNLPLSSSMTATLRSTSLSVAKPYLNRSVNESKLPLERPELRCTEVRCNGLAVAQAWTNTQERVCRKGTIERIVSCTRFKNKLRNDAGLTGRRSGSWTRKRRRRSTGPGIWKRIEIGYGECSPRAMNMLRI
ncbi:unnamed protein product [Ectocarpus sp. 8 AP-2014]